MTSQQMHDQLSHCETSFTVKEDEVGDIFKKVERAKILRPRWHCTSLAQNMCGRVIAYFHRIVSNVTFAETYPRHLETFGYCACSKEEKAECHE